MMMATLSKSETMQFLVGIRDGKINPRKLPKPSPLQEWKAEGIPAFASYNEKYQLEIWYAEYYRELHSGKKISYTELMELVQRYENLSQFFIFMTVDQYQNQTCFTSILIPELTRESIIRISLNNK